MKKIFAFVLSFLLLFYFLIGCSTRGKDEIKTRKNFVVGLDVNVMPMGFLNEKGDLDGVDIELARAVFLNNPYFQSHYIGIIFQPINWDAKEMELNSGNIDCIWNGMSYTNERDEQMKLSRSYIKNSQILVVSKDSNIKELKEAKGKTICTQKGSTGFDAIKNSNIFSEKEIENVVQLENMVDCLNEVLVGHSFGAVLDEVVFKYFVNKKGLEGKFKVLKEPLSKEDYVIAFRKDDAKLKEEVEKGLLNLIKTKKAEEISKKWFGENIIDLKEVEGKQKNSVKQNDFGFSFELFKGLLVSLKLFFLCILLSIPLGLLICFLRVKEIKILNILIDSYTLLMRGTPLLLQILFAFYGLPIIFKNFFIKDRFLIGLFAFVINYAAYFVEIFRGGYKSIDRGQFDAIKVLDIPKNRAIFRIILPQMFNVCLPSLCNETITLVKDTALIFSIGVVELLTVSKNMVNNMVSIKPYLWAALLYLLVCFLIYCLFKFFEKKLKY